MHEGEKAVDFLIRLFNAILESDRMPEEEVCEYQFSGTMCRAGDVQNCSNADDDQWIAVSSSK